MLHETLLREIVERTSNIRAAKSVTLLKIDLLQPRAGGEGSGSDIARNQVCDGHPVLS
jgi:hypothetical protein